MSWLDEAACKGQPTALFFPKKGNAIATGQRFCTACPVRIDCLIDAVETDDWIALRGGMSSNSRDTIRGALRRMVASGDRESLARLSRMSTGELVILRRRDAA